MTVDRFLHYQDLAKESSIRRQETIVSMHFDRCICIRDLELLEDERLCLSF